MSLIFGKHFAFGVFSRVILLLPLLLLLLLCYGVDLWTFVKRKKKNETTAVQIARLYV